MEGLREKRLKANLKLREVAKAVGVATNTLCMYEKGSREPNFKMLKKLANFFDCKIDDLM